MSVPYIPATALDGTLFPRPVRLGGWIGWCEWKWSPGTWSARTFDAGLPTRGDVRFDPRDPGVAHRVADILRRKGHEVDHLLPVALGGRQGDVVAETVCPDGDNCAEALRFDTRQWDCETCNCTGKVLLAIPAADVSAVLLAASVAGVEAGRGVVREVLGEWARADLSPGVERWARQGIVGDALAYSRAALPEGQQVGWGLRPHPSQTTDSGPETGPPGRAAADAALLRLGCAYLDPAAPFGVVVPSLNLENER